MAYNRNARNQNARSKPVAPPVQQMAAPAFPRMPVDEIMEDLRLFEHPMSRDSLRKPTAEGVRSVFLCFIAKLYGKTEDDLRQPAFGCLDVLANPELHDDAVPTLQILEACQKMFAAARYGDGFGLNDLLMPEPKRFLWQMSALINFAKFREKRVRELQDMNDNAVAMRERSVEMEGLNAQIDGQIEEIEQRRAAEAPKVAQEQALVDDLMTELSQLHQSHVMLTEDTKQAKAKLHTAVETISKLKFRHLTLEQETEQLRSGIVISPDRVQSEIKEMEERVEEDKKRLLEVQTKTRATSERAGKISKAARDISNACKAVEEASVEMERSTAMEQRVKEQKAKIREYENEKKAIASTCAHLKRQIASLEARRERVRQQRDELDDQDRQSAAKLMQQSRDADSDIDTAKETIAQNNRRANEIARNMEQLVVDFEDEVSSISRKLTLVDRKLSSHCKDLEETNGLVDAANRKALAELQNTIQSAVHQSS